MGEGVGGGGWDQYVLKITKRGQRLPLQNDHEMAHTPSTKSGYIFQVSCSCISPHTGAVYLIFSINPTLNANISIIFQSIENCICHSVTTYYMTIIFIKLNYSDVFLVSGDTWNPLV